jgi:hypothetical protein
MRLGLALNNMIRKRDRDRSTGLLPVPVTPLLWSSLFFRQLTLPSIPLECETVHWVANEIEAEIHMYLRHY